jgi:hypothetical protein
VQSAHQFCHEFAMLAKEVRFTNKHDPVGCQAIEDFVRDRSGVEGHTVALDDLLQLLSGNLGPQRTGCCQ